MINSRSSKRRLAFAAAVALGAGVTAPAGSQAATPLLGCKQPASNTSWSYVKSGNASQDWGAEVAAVQAARAYTTFTHAKLAQVASGGQIVVKIGDLGSGTLGVTNYSCASNGIFSGPVTITIGRRPIVEGPFERLQSAMSHEFGHALGLTHYNATSGTCPSGDAKAISIMTTQLLVRNAGCFPQFPTGEDAAAINSMYK